MHPALRDVPPHRIGLLLLFLSTLLAYGLLFDYVILLQYQTPASFFVFSSQFLAQWLDHPGGILLWAGRFLRQLFHYEWLGALVVASLATGLAAILHRVRSGFGQPVGIFHTLAPGIVLAALHSASTVTVGLLAAAGALWGYLALPKGKPRQAGALLGIPLLYVVAGGYAWFFATWVIGAAWLRRPWSAGLALKLALPAVAVGMPLIAYRWLFQVSLRGAWLSPFSVPEAWIDRLFFLYVLGLPLWPRVDWGARLEALNRSRPGTAVQAALLVGLAAALLGSAYDPAARQFAGYHRLYQRGEWDAILERARTSPLPDAMGQYFTNRALGQRGKLLEEMFRYRQSWGTHGLILHLPDAAEYGRWAMYNSDLYYEMGHVNAAYRLAYNQTTLVGETYANLRRIAECTMVNGSYEIAAKCLGILERTLFQRDFARHYQRLIADPARADLELAGARARLPAVELDINLGEYAAVLALVKSNPRNRLAFDYLMAWCLLDKTLLPVVAQSVRRLADAGYGSLPTHCQEALMVWQSATGAPVDSRVITYDAAAMQRFERFGEQLDRQPDRSSAEGGLRPEFGGTYMYYFVLATTPLEGTPSSSWLRLGNELFSQGRRDEAGIYYHQARLKHPESVAAGVSLGDLAAQPGAWSEASGAPAERGLELRSHY